MFEEAMSSFSRGSWSHSDQEDSDEKKALRLLVGKGRSGGNDAEDPNQLVWLVNFVERPGESPVSYWREKITQHFPCFVIPQPRFLNHSGTLENAVLNVYSCSLKSVGIKDFWWEWQRGPLRSCSLLACDMNGACCANVVLCSFQGIYYSLGKRKYHLFPFMQTINQHDISSMWSNAAQCASTWEEQIRSKFWNT